MMTTLWRKQPEWTLERVKFCMIGYESLLLCLLYSQERIPPLARRAVLLFGAGYIIFYYNAGKILLLQKPRLIYINSLAKKGTQVSMNPSSLHCASKTRTIIGTLNRTISTCNFQPE